VRSPREEWERSVGTMARTLAHIWANRLIFYKALRARFSELPRLELRFSIKKADEAVQAFNRLFQRAVERSGDYEPLLMPDERDWATELVFMPLNALDAWRGLLKGLEPIDFHEIPSDIVGRIFQKLISPEERHRYGQHFTGDDVVDLINCFCIRKANAKILDPACGSGSFLVRAYYRKRNLNLRRSHLDLISELFGCDIALYPAHLATLNLASREINEEANYPRIARNNFFDIDVKKPFCRIPDGAGAMTNVSLGALDSVVGNPPYVRQEKIEKYEKARYSAIAETAFPGIGLSGRSDLHCYFWPAAARWLEDGAYFGFLTSSSWLDVEHGFPLQGWILGHFRIVAIMESAAEPWFEDARIKTCITILQKCKNEAARMNNRIRFVRFKKKLADIVGVSPDADEPTRQAAFEKLRSQILRTEKDCSDENVRIIIKDQKCLWEDGIRAGSVLGDGTRLLEPADDDEEDMPPKPIPKERLAPPSSARQGIYVAGK
jgi:methylase of polypeptide subunit release factors